MKNTIMTHQYAKYLVHMSPALKNCAGQLIRMLIHNATLGGQPIHLNEMKRALSLLHNDKSEEPYTKKK